MSQFSPSKMGILAHEAVLNKIRDTNAKAVYKCEVLFWWLTVQNLIRAHPGQHFLPLLRLSSLKYCNEKCEIAHMM